MKLWGKSVFLKKKLALASRWRLFGVRVAVEGKIYRISKGM